MSKSAVTSRSVTTVSDLVERPDGLWEYQGKTLEDAAAIFLEIEGKVNSAQWAMGAICAAVEDNARYGDHRVEEFAIKVKYTPRHVRRMARTYREAIEKGCYRPNLTFTHHTEALSHPDPDEALDAAEAEDMSSLGLREWVNEQASQNATKPQKSFRKKRQNEFREFLERVDSIILTDFMETCPNAEWGRRVFKNWRDDVTWELSQIAHTEAADRVSDAVLDGALTIQDIKSATGLPNKDIEFVVGGKVKSGLWEWVREGGETDMARGSRRTILHVIGTAVAR
jgi:hypothetical protein